MKKIFSVAGCIASGKTTYAENLAKYTDAKLVVEDFGQNPYLEKYYDNMAENAFNMQKWYLGKRYEQLKDLQKIDNEIIIIDQMFAAFGCVYPLLQNKLGILEDKWLGKLFSVYGEYRKDNDIEKYLEDEIIIYLRVTSNDIEKLICRIQKRGREYEKSLDISYLRLLVNQFEDWFSIYKGKVIVVNAFQDIENVSGESIKEIINAKVILKENFC